MNQLPQLRSEALHQLYTVVDNLKCDEIHAAQGKQVAKTRVHVKLAHIIRLAKAARKEILPRGKRAKTMEKYAVDQDKDLKKTAEEEEEDGTRCPNCKEVLTKHGNVTLCPDCGSEPFEESEAKTESSE